MNATQTERAKAARKQLHSVAVGAGIPIALPTRGTSCPVEDSDGIPCCCLAVLVIAGKPMCEHHANAELLADRKGGGR